MDFQSAMETFAEAWAAANATTQVFLLFSHILEIYIVYTNTLLYILYYTFRLQIVYDKQD